MISALVAIAVGRLSLEYINQSVTAHRFFYLHSEGDLFDSLFIWRVFNGRSVGYECSLCVVGGKKAQKTIWLCHLRSAQGLSSLCAFTQCPSSLWLWNRWQCESRSLLTPIVNPATEPRFHVSMKTRKLSFHLALPQPRCLMWFNLIKREVGYLDILAYS